MRILKKTGLVLLCLFVCFFVVAAILSISSRPWYYRLMYPWDRITGTVSLEIDGKACEIKAEQVTACAHGTASVRFKAVPKNECTRISVHAGDHGLYSFLIAVEGVSQPLEIVCYQYNWWNTCEFDLHISVDHITNTVSFASASKVLNEEGQKVPENHSRTLDLNDEVLRFAVVSA